MIEYMNNENFQEYMEKNGQGIKNLLKPFLESQSPVKNL